MCLFILLLGFFQLTPSSASQPLEQSKSQGEYYIQQIREGNEVDKHLWALTVLSTSNPQTQAFIEQTVKHKNQKNDTLSLFSNIEGNTADQLKKVVFQTGSADLLIALLLSDSFNNKKIYSDFLRLYDLPTSNGVNYRDLCKAIIQQEQITKQTLPAGSFQLTHFFLLSDKNRRQYISENYLAAIANNWDEHLSGGNHHNLKLPQVTLLQSLYLIDRYAEIIPFYHSVLQSELFPNSPLKLRIFRYIDYSIYRTGRYDRNLEIVRNALLPLAQFLNDQQAELSIRELLGVYFYSIGKLHQAKNNYLYVLRETESSNSSINLTSLYNNLGITYLKLGQYDKYLELQFKALEQAKEADNYSHELDIYNNLFVYYNRLKDKNNAFRYLNEALTLAQKEGGAEDLGIIYTSLGSSFRKFDNNFQESHAYLSKATQYLDHENNTRYFIELLNEEAETYEQQQKYQQALAKHDRIIKLTSKKANNPTYIDALINKALINLKMGQIQAAKELIDQFSSFQLQQLDFEQIVKANTVKADFFNRNGKPDQALQLLDPTIEQLLERVKSSTDLQSGYWHIADEYLDAFDLAVEIHLQQNQPEKAVAILDQLKTINDASIYQNPLVKASLLDESELTQYKKITQRLDAQRKKLLTTPDDQKFAINQRINELELQKRKFDRRISSEADNESISVAEVQRQLAAHQLVLHVTELKDQYYIAKISRSEVTVEQTSLNQKIRDLFNTSVQQVANHTTDLDSLYAISRLLNIQSIPNRIDDITIIPDSYLYQLPIDILPLKKPVHKYSYGATQYFIEKYTTRYLTSLNDFKEETEHRSNRDYKWDYVGYGISEFGDAANNLVPLPFAPQEVTSIKDQLTNFQKTRTFTNTQSKKTTFSKTAPQARILHLATHSQVSERDPMFSTIHLSKDDSIQTDSTFANQLFAYELFGLHLDNEMIMLNSCKSGSGSYIQGTGIMGFSRALQYAGAKSLVLNVWSVNDMLASDFAIHFYEQLNQGKSKAEALQNTKRYFLSSKNASPHFWGPYMLIGDKKPIVEPNRKMNLAVAGTFLFYFLLLAILSYLTTAGVIFQRPSS